MLAQTLQRIAAKYPVLFRVLKHGIVPAAFYFAAFFLLAFSLFRKFSSQFWGDRTDGLQNAWNLWWVNLVVHRLDLYSTIWYTDLLHWPFGTTLLGHTLSPFDGYLAVLLLNFLSLKTAFNTIVVFAVVMAGLTMYWLAYSLTRSWWSALLAGCMYCFSSYIFMHLAAGHLSVLSAEWIPLFLLCWYRLLTRPTVLRGLAAALALWLAILGDYYYFFYCVLAALVILIWYAAVRRDVRFLVRREHLLPLATFALIALIFIGPQVFSLLVANQRDPLMGAHDPAAYSLDLLAILIPGRTWFFNQWTQFFWSRLPVKWFEFSAYLTLPACFLLVYAWLRRKSLDTPARQQLYLWSALLIVFLLLALGPVLHIAGSDVWDKGMPYTLLAYLLPSLSISGVPARMAIMVILAGCLLSAFGFRELLSQFPRTRWLTFALVAVLLIQTVPISLPSTVGVIPDYVTALAGLPDDGGVVDLIQDNPSLQMLYQTVHGKPIAFGYIARIPASVATRDQALKGAIQTLDYEQLCGVYHIRYIVAPGPLLDPSDPSLVTLTAVYHTPAARIYRLEC